MVFAGQILTSERKTIFFEARKNQRLEQSI